MIAGAAGRLRPPGFALKFAAGRDAWLLIVISLCHKCQTCLSTKGPAVFFFFPHRKQTFLSVLNRVVHITVEREVTLW